LVQWMYCAQPVSVFQPTSNFIGGAVSHSVALEPLF